MALRQHIGFYAGSFDPFTKGHLNICCQALKGLDKLVVGIGINPEKEALFSPEERAVLVKDSLNDLLQTFKYRDLVSLDLGDVPEEIIARYEDNPDIIEVVAYDDLTIDAAMRVGATKLVRGERIIGDHEAEMALYSMNTDLLKVRGYDMEMSIIPSTPNLTNISSSNAKMLARWGEYIAAQNYVTPTVHKKMMEKYLFKPFCEVCHYFNIEKTRCTDEYDAIVKAHSGGRFYHTLTHVADCLNRLKIYHSTVGKIPDYNFMRLAFFYHDFYQGDMAEERSKKKMLQFVSHLNVADKEKLVRLLDATKHDGSIDKNDFSSQLMSDIDLCVLGAEKYGDYAAKIRQEYTTFDDLVYAKGRISVLEGLLKSDTLYYTDYFKRLLTHRGVSNISKEIQYWNALQNHGCPGS